MAGSFGIIFSKDHKEVLLVKRRDVPAWVLPGGGIEKDESPEQAVIREVFEETGYRVNIVRKTGEYRYPKKNKINHVYECKISGGEKTLSSESKAIEYFPIQKVPKMTHPHSLIFVKDALENQNSTVIKKICGYGLPFILRMLVNPWFFFKFILIKIGIHWNT